MPETNIEPVPEASRKYWRRELDGAVPLALPRLPVSADKIKRDFALPPSLVELLHDFAAQRGLLIPTIILSAAAILLHRYILADDLVFAVRDDSNGMEEATTTLIRLKLSGNLTFKQLLQAVSDSLARARRHTWRGGRTLQEVLLSDLGIDFFFPFLVAFGNAVDSDTQAVAVSFSIQDGSIKGTFTGPTVWARNGILASLKRHLKNIMRAAIVANETTFLNLEGFSPSEKHRLLVEWNASIHIHGEESFVERFERQADTQPGAAALISEDRTFTYRALNESANRLAHYLLMQGVSLESPVGVYLERSVESVLSVLAILKAGGTFVPLDPDYPQARVLEMIRDSGLALVISNNKVPHGLPHTLRIICLDDSASAIAATGANNIGARVRAENAISLLYTSGSSGVPKGVVETHGALESRIMAALSDIGPEDVCAWSSSLNFGISTSRLLVPLALGATVVILDDEQVRNTDRFFTAMETHGVTSLFAVPALLQQILQGASTRGRSLSRLRCIAVSGGNLSTGLALEVTRYFPQVELINIYGGSEIGTAATVKVVGPQTEAVSIGTPVANTRVYLVDRHMNLVPPGVTGELCVAANHIARGYRGRPDLTAETFLPDPFGGPRGGRLLRTGDLARHLPNGEIEFIGRGDSQVKVRGYRIELGEIETALQNHWSVAGATVICRQVGPDSRLVAFVVGKNGYNPSPAELRTYLTERIPHYMIPSEFQTLDAFPLTAAGKINRNALLAADTPSYQSSFSCQPPRDEIEEAVTALWKDELQLPTVGIDDSLLELGGDSVIASRIVLRLTDIYDIDLSVASLLETPTVRSVADIIRLGIEKEPG
ncbi:MAG TPA: amino acid adenylation domain-containing protein [Terriglobia bacterium]|nr:amino acid adenylation domain-containing protein [Terriglobia bacterium]